MTSTYGNGASVPVSQLQDQMSTMRDWGTRKLPSGFEIPRIAEPVFEIGAQLVPAYGLANQIVLCTHTVPTNYDCLITGIVLGYQGGAPVPLPGDILYTVDVDRPLGLLTAGYDVKDYGNVPIQVGSLLFQPWPVEFRHASGEILRVKGTSIANVGVGAPNFLLAALVGFEWPAREG